MGTQELDAAVRDAAQQAMRSRDNEGATHMTNTIRQIDQLTTAIEAHGYFVMMKPIAGEEPLFVEALREALTKIESTLSHFAKHHRMRGRSKRALAALHRYLPEPAWGVEAAK